MKVDEKGNDTSDITGKIIINDLRDEDDVKTSTVDVKCLSCGTRIVGSDDETEET